MPIPATCSNGDSMLNPSSELIRFFLVASLGLAVDIGVAWWLIVSIGSSDPIAAAAGLLAGMIFNYFLHLNWTFKDTRKKATIVQFMKYTGTVLFTLLIRIIVLKGIQDLELQSILIPPFRLFISAAIAFVFSYFLCRWFVYGSPAPTEGTSNQ